VVDIKTAAPKENTIAAQLLAGRLTGDIQPTSEELEIIEGIERYGTDFPVPRDLLPAYLHKTPDTSTFIDAMPKGKKVVP
jgi:hypothetical protein